MMRREQVIAYVKEKYGIEADYPWPRTPKFAILRHRHNRKWFGAIVNVAENKLGLAGDKMVDALNLKCDPELAASLRGAPGILPAWHMNKEHWLTIQLTGPIKKEKVCDLLDLSYELTK